MGAALRWTRRSMAQGMHPLLAHCYVLQRADSSFTHSRIYGTPIMCQDCSGHWDLAVAVNGIESLSSGVYILLRETDDKQRNKEARRFQIEMGMRKGMAGRHVS